jgi:hypothetical protein
MKSSRSFFAIVSMLLISTVQIACIKSKSPAPAQATGLVALHLHTNLDTNEVAGYDSIYVVPGNRKVSLSMAQLFISNIQLIRLDGSTYTIPDTVILKILANEVYMIGQAPVGNYQSIRFNVGLSSSVNAQAPSGNSIFNNSSMWFGFSNYSPNYGYAFVNVQGKIDTSSAGNAPIAKMQSFSYQIGISNTNLSSVTMPSMPYTITTNNGSPQYIHIIIDYYKLFNGIDITNPSNLTFMIPAIPSVHQHSALEDSLGLNIPAMFRYEY